MSSSGKDDERRKPPGATLQTHNISPSLLYHWQKQYSVGKFNNEPIEEVK